MVVLQTTRSNQIAFIKRLSTNVSGIPEIEVKDVMHTYL